MYRNGNSWAIYSPNGTIVSTRYFCIECEKRFNSSEGKEAHYLSNCTEAMHKWHVETDYYSKAGRFPTMEQYRKHEEWLEFLESGQEERYNVL